MRPLLIILLTAACGLLAHGKTLRYDEHDLELEMPWDWLPSPKEPGVVIVMHDQIPQKIGGDTSVGSKAAALMVATFPKEVAIDPKAVVQRQREAMELKGAVAVGAGQRQVGPLLFHTTTFAQSARERPTSYLCTAFGNERAVTLVLSSRVVDPSKDPQLDGILRSVRFLSPYRPLPELTFGLRVRNFVHRRPLTVTVLSVTGLAAAGLLVVIVRQSCKS